MVDSLDAVFYTCIFILPGFIIQEIAERLSPRKRQTDARYILKCLLYSIANCAMLSWIYLAIGKLRSGHPYKYWLLTICVTIIGALLISFVIGLVEQYGLIPKLFWFSRISVAHSQPTAWDYFFSKGESAWVIVTLVDGSKIYGKYSNLSFSSSDSVERDLYIEETFHLDDNSKWILDSNSLGVLIAKDQIRAIEFIKMEE